MQYHVALIGTQSELISSLESTLVQQGYRISRISSDIVNLSQIGQLMPDLIVMQLSISHKPYQGLFHRLASELRKTPIMLLGNDNIQNRVASLNICANDYLPVPFATEEFLARVRAKLRRVAWEKRDETFIFADLRLDTQTSEVHHKNQLIELTAKEYDLLKHLMTYPRQVLTRQQILDAIWSNSLLADDSNVVQVYVRSLRRKLGVASRFIQTVRGVGYVLRDDSG